MTQYLQYSAKAGQIITRLRYDFGFNNTNIRFIEERILETDAFRNDVFAAQRNQKDWHRNFADVAMDIVECARGQCGCEYLAAYAAVSAGSTYIAETQLNGKPRGSPSEYYATALATLTELNDAAAEAETESYLLDQSGF